jgi:hypothetical protein
MQKPANLLWTSGWESTYRLLDLVLIQKRPVQPFYIISRSRKSCEIEMQTMEKIKALLFYKSPEAKKLVLPTVYKERSEIKPNECITDQYKRLAGNFHLGDQYEYLARFAEEAGIDTLELCVNRETQRAGCFTQLIYPTLVKEVDGNSFNYRAVGSPDHPDLLLFKYFRFPTHQLSKLDTQELATKNGFIDIMNQTWFCHSPINQQPCGVCNPCCMTIEEGLGNRIPLRSQIRHFIHYTVKPPIKNILKPAKKEVAVH